MLSIELKKDFVKALNNTNNAHSKIAYKFAIELLNTIPETVKLQVRANANGQAYNIGDLGEVIFKYHLDNNNELRYSFKDENDLDRVIKNELKTFSNSNRYPNGLTEPKGFYSISHYGIHYITKQMVVKYWNEFRPYKDQMQPTLKVLKDIIANERPKLFISMTEKMIN